MSQKCSEPVSEFYWCITRHSSDKEWNILTPPQIPEVHYKLMRHEMHHGGRGLWEQEWKSYR